MKILRKILLLMSFLFVIMTNASCAAKVFEKEINVVFMYEDEFISSDTVTQFKNIKSPELSDAYIPDGYKFFGWTPYDPDSVKATDENFKEKYIGAGKMVHWADVANYVKGETVILRSLMIDKNEMAMSAGVELSYLGSRDQAKVYKIVERESTAPSIAQAAKLRKTAENGELDDAMLEYILTSTKQESIKLVIYEDKLRRYFPKSYTKEQIEDTVMKLIQKWHKNREKENER